MTKTKKGPHTPPPPDVIEINRLAETWKKRLGFWKPGSSKKTFALGSDCAGYGSELLALKLLGLQARVKLLILCDTKLWWSSVGSMAQKARSSTTFFVVARTTKRRLLSTFMSQDTLALLLVESESARAAVKNMGSSPCRACTTWLQNAHGRCSSSKYLRWWTRCIAICGNFY